MSSETGAAVRKQPSIPNSGCGAQVWTDCPTGTCIQKSDTIKGNPESLLYFLSLSCALPTLFVPSVLQPYIPVSVWVRGQSIDLPWLALSL